MIVPQPHTSPRPLAGAAGGEGAVISSSPIHLSRRVPRASATACQAEGNVPPE